MQQHGFVGPPVLSSLLFVSAVCRLYSLIKGFFRVFLDSCRIATGRWFLEAPREAAARVAACPRGDVRGLCGEDWLREEASRSRGRCPGWSMTRGARMKGCRSKIFPVDCWYFVFVTIEWNEDEDCCRGGPQVRSRGCSNLEACSAYAWFSKRGLNILPFCMAVGAFWVLCWPAWKCREFVLWGVCVLVFRVFTIPMVLHYGILVACLLERAHSVAISEADIIMFLPIVK